MNTTTASPLIDMSGLEASPAAWFGWLSAAVSRGDDAQVRRCQARLAEMDPPWLVLSPQDLARLREEQAAAQAQEQPAEDPGPAADQPEPEPEPVAIEEAGPS